MLHIGDNLDKDFKAAMQFGAQGLLYRPYGIKEEEQPIKGVHYVHSIKDLLLGISKEKIWFANSLLWLLSYFMDSE